ncbi:MULTISPECIES: response regulator transcription factor [unclassified Modestobacter]|uniref:response regulator transcription factor n=1 Tax=unclassified Modestobacter TaxID=2643866 RepID=UPI0022AABCE7|nr:MULTISPECIES: response regulator transcription factor [unclassified Modestobacter]MCZ2813191.1 response regulator transcription factor [Modestobacter sp. VKM Ac-2979]MCZ2842780.1 response regulator transcription factor [Modestobacter sp. VKM Ac-2980]MCZ2847394.1 response regulator transcription factor [Modestobacter sp. VKM Ac-2978]
MTGVERGLRVVLVDDHRLFRESLGALLAVHEGIEVVAEGANGEEAVRLARQHRPDVVLLDVEMPGQSVLTSLVEIRSASPSTRIVVLTMHENTPLARQLLLRGASAYLIKTIGHHELVAAIRAATDREQDLITLSVSRGGLAGLTSQGGPMLSEREVEVLALVGKARSNAAIAAELRISEGTVKRHLSNINAKLGSTSRLDAVRRATRARLLAPGLGDD